MRVMVVDGGARGQALGMKLASECEEVFVSPGNPGNEDFAEGTGIAPTDIAGQLDFARRNNVDLTVVGADDPLALGIVDAFRAEKLAIFGPTQKQAQIETDRAYAKRFAAQADLPMGTYAEFTDKKAAMAYAERRAWPLFVKDNELAQGKGAKRCEDLPEFQKQIRQLGQKVIVEDYVSGPEASHHAFCDGRSCLSFPFLVRDHKTIGENETSPMTGGMGVAGPLLNYTISDVEGLGATFVEPVVQKLGFSGVLFSGLKGAKGQEKLLEWNARPGDPETQAYMALMKSELLPILRACVEGELAEAKPPEWYLGQSVVSLVLAAPDYPEQPRRGLTIEGLSLAASVPGVHILHAATKKEHGRLVTDGGRVLNVLVVAGGLLLALNRAYLAAEQIAFDSKPPIIRRDIGHSVLVGI